MKTQLYPKTIICILILVCSSCSITRQTTCPTFANKTEKIHKPLFSKKQSSKKKKKQCVKISDQTKKEKTKNNQLAKIENIISKIEMSDLAVSSPNDIALNSTDIPPFYPESKIQKSIYKKVEKKNKKILSALEKHNQKRDIEQTENCKQIISKKKGKRKRKKIFNNKDDKTTDEREVHDLAILSLSAGIALYFTPFLIPLINVAYAIFAILFTVFAIIWGFKGRKRIKENPSKYKGKKMALAGIILGFIAAGILIFIG